MKDNQTPAQRLQTLRAEAEILKAALPRLQAEQSSLTRRTLIRNHSESSVNSRLTEASSKARRWETPKFRQMSNAVDHLPAAAERFAEMIGFGWSYKRAQLLESAPEEAARLAEQIATAEQAMDTATTATAFESARKQAESSRRRLVAHEVTVRLVEASRYEEQRRVEDLEQWAAMAQAENTKRQQVAEDAAERLQPAEEKLERVSARLEQLQSEIQQTEAQLVEAL